MQQLQENGFNTTQATISRDIKQLRIIKELGPNGTYRYSASAKPVEHAFSSKLNIIFSPVSYTHLPAASSSTKQSLRSSS